MNLYEEHLYLDGATIQHVRVNQMAVRQLKPEYVDLQIVPSSSEDHSYLVGRVRVLDKPQPIADIADDETEIIVCSCDDWYFTQSKHVDKDKKPSDCGTCKHGKAAYKSVQAAADDAQQSLL